MINPKHIYGLLRRSAMDYDVHGVPSEWFDLYDECFEMFSLHQLKELRDVLKKDYQSGIIQGDIDSLRKKGE